MYFTSPTAKTALTMMCQVYSAPVPGSCVLSRFGVSRSHARSRSSSLMKKQGTVLPTEAADKLGKGSVLPTKTVERQGE